MSRIRSDALESVVLTLCERIDTPRSLAVWLCFKYNQADLIDLPLPAVATLDTEKFRLDYFITEYLSKYKGLKVPVDPRDVALGKWRLSEVQCSDTNRRFKALRHRPFTGRVEAALYRAQRKIAAVLGTLHVPLVLDGCKWGPGATYDLKRTEATPDKKISRAISVTAAALPYFRSVVESDPHWAYCFLGVMPWGQFSLLPNCFNIVRGSRFLTVPKSAKTDRCIAAEPTGNSFLQQGVHSYMRRRLKRFGVDLDDQSINQRHARDAYASALSTLDLSAASDSIATEVVYHLLPLDWALFLDSLRSPETFLGGKLVGWVRTEKFASMGNAFCFELETLIFWALASSVDEVSGGVDSRVSVYGDDIIVPRAAYDSVVELLGVCGFTVNGKKSFKDGYFFESCGKHYHRGVDVTPVYQKEVLSHPSEIIRAHNRLVRLAFRIPGEQKWFLFTRALRALTEMWPHRPFPRVPYGVAEDGGFLRPLSEFSLDVNHGFRCHVYDFVPRLIGGREDAMYAYKLRRIMSRSLVREFGRSKPRTVLELMELGGDVDLPDILGRDAMNFNPDPSGRGSNVSEGSWRTKVRWISEVSVLEGGNPDEADALLTP